MWRRKKKCSGWRLQGVYPEYVYAQTKRLPCFSLPSEDPVLSLLYTIWIFEDLQHKIQDLFLFFNTVVAAGLKNEVPAVMYGYRLVQYVNIQPNFITLMTKLRHHPYSAVPATWNNSMQLLSIMTNSLLPVWRGTVMCSLQSIFTTSLPPLSNCLTIRPSNDSFSIRSLTS